MRFVLVDRLLEIEPARAVRAEVTFPADLDIFADHFPGHPMVPGVLLTEAMSQAGGWLVAVTAGLPVLPLLVRIDRATFRRAVAPGEHLLISAALRSGRGDSYEVIASAECAGEEVAHARLLFHVIPVAPEGEARAAFETWSRETFERLGGPAALRKPGEGLP